MFVIRDYLCTVTGGELVGGTDALDARFASPGDVQVTPGLLDHPGRLAQLGQPGPDRVHPRRGLLRHLRYEHRRASADLALAIPDAIAWCWAKGGDWRRRIEPVVTDVREI